MARVSVIARVGIYHKFNEVRRMLRAPIIRVHLQLSRILVDRAVLLGPTLHNQRVLFECNIIVGFRIRRAIDHSERGEVGMDKDPC